MVRVFALARHGISEEDITTKHTNHTKKNTNKKQETRNGKLSHDLQRLLRGSRQYRSIADFDDGTLKQRRILDDVLDDIAGRSFGVESEFLCLSLALAKDLERRKSKLHYQFSERLLSERLIKVVDPICVDAVFTKQLCQISARRSGRFFVNGDFIFCHASSITDHLKLPTLDQILQSIVDSFKWLRGQNLLCVLCELCVGKAGTTQSSQSAQRTALQVAVLA